MKDFLLLIIGGAILVAVFADGGLELSPTISPSLAGRLDVVYSPSTTTTTIEQQTNIDTNIERQQTTIIYQDAPVGPAGVNLVDVGAGRCATQVGDVLESEQGQGACYVVNAGQRFFVNPNGNRWPVANGATGAGTGTRREYPPVALMPLAQPAALSPPGELTVDQLQAAFLRNGGSLPWFWNMRTPEDQRTFLTQQGATWR